VLVGSKNSQHIRLNLALLDQAVDDSVMEKAIEIAS
jgi:hypothetical protein